ncbi:hypothetical protein GBL_1804 [Geobacillus kaustophilus GBlys]|uniref:Uncharacterized protein n=1 Tax=Geobacillus kaustophilus GBlys TaxID=1337888 RepID=U2X4H2_GEOKU|nr:hypothetical protein GBL_1804 [Geobacillus kaustophilus GBlys]
MFVQKWNFRLSATLIIVSKEDSRFRRVKGAAQRSVEDCRLINQRLQLQPQIRPQR